jgi:dTDP-4-dehydrorhamnose reductase
MLGSSLCRLFDKAYEVYAFHRDKTCLVNCKGSFSIDLLDSQGIKTIINSINPDLVIHCAAIIDIERCEKYPKLAYDLNVRITENVVKSCSAKTKIIYISTDQVYGHMNVCIESNNKLNPVNEYGKSKLLGERKVQEITQNYIIIRTNIFGWNIKKNKVSSAEWMYNSLNDGNKIKLFTDYVFSPIYTMLLGEIMMQLVVDGYKGIINIGSVLPCSKYKFGIAIAKRFNLNPSLISESSIKEFKFVAPRCPDLTMDFCRIFDLGIKLPSYHKSINAFYTQNK